jgi:hypothetical protein
MLQRFHLSAALRTAFGLTLTLAASWLPATVNGPSAARAEAPGQYSAPAAGAQTSSYAPELKRLQHRLLLQGARARMARAKALTHLLRKHPGQVRPGTGVRRRGDWNEAGGPQGTGTRALRELAASPARATAALGPDVLVNDRTQDVLFETIGQAEQMIAAQGANVLIAWNDGLGFAIAPYTSTQGYGYSVDGGVTYTDGGAPPAPAGWRWASDPLVTVNEKTGDFWFCAMVDDNSTRNGIALVKARFTADTVQWSTPALVRSGNNSSVLFDKPWIAADSLSGRLYLSYTVFGVSADTIVFQRSSVGGTTWDSPQRLSSNTEAGYVQGSRPVVGPTGEVYVTWYSIGWVDVDYMKIRKSTDQGATFSAAVNVASVYSNFGSGAPGFNRGTGITYPSIAVDRSTGTHRGRVYLAWNESVDFYDAALGTTGSVSETEINGTPATADAFTPGKILRGSLSANSDFDFFSFNGNAGQTLVFYADSVSPAFDMSLRLFCSDGTTRLALSAPGPGPGHFICFTPPASGTYYLRCASWDGSSGSYRISTGLDTPTTGERARDHRDVFVAWSDDGATWSTPARASDSPVGYDDWLPEVAVGGDHADARVGDGRPYCLWYDWRESASICGGGSNIYLSRSDDHGAIWTPVGALNAMQTDWTNTGSNILPNQGDYLSLFAAHSNLYAAWADGRNGDPDIYAVTVPLLTTPVEAALASVEATPERVTLTWYGSALGDQVFTIERRETATDFVAIGETTSDGVGKLVFADATVSPGNRYAYRLAWLEGATQQTTSEVWVDVPAAPAAPTFALHGARPNPASRRTGVFISLVLPDAMPATLELLDVAGRQLARLQLQGAGEHQQVNISEGLALEPGIYLVRLTQGGKSLTHRVTVVP